MILIKDNPSTKSLFISRDLFFPRHGPVLCAARLQGMTHLLRFFTLYFLVLGSFSALGTELTNQPLAQSQLVNWDAWHLRLDLGIATKAAKSSETGVPRHYVEGPMLEYGVECGWVFAKKWYFGVDSTWNFFYPDSFVDTSIEPWKMILIPITHLHAGYIFDDESLLTLGSTYFWGVIGTYRKPYAPKKFWEVKVVRWLDEPWDGDLPFHQAIHRWFITAGFGFQL